MGRNRLEDKIQQAVWQTVLRGPRLPSNRWTKSNPFATQNAQKNTKAPEGKAMKHPGQNSTPPRVSRGGAGSRPKLRAVWDVGRGRRDVPTITAALQKAEVQAQERPISDVHQPETKEGRADPVGDREGEGGFVQSSNRTGGARSIISRRRAEVRSTPREREGSAVAVHSSTACNHTERPGRVQEVARDYRQSAARTRTPSVWGLSHTFPDDDDDMVADLHHKKTKVGSQTPAVISGCAPRTPLAITGGHGQIHRPYNATPV